MILKLAEGRIYTLFVKCIGIFPGTGIDFRDRAGNVYLAMGKENPDLYMEWTDAPVATDQPMFKHNQCILIRAKVLEARMSDLHGHIDYRISGATLCDIPRIPRRII
jgi:hypothetical protein